MERLLIGLWKGGPQITATCVPRSGRPQEEWQGIP